MGKFIMNKDNAHLYLPLVQALADGKTIQMADAVNINREGYDWSDDEGEIMFDSPIEYYRIKPEPKECWARLSDSGDMVDYYTGKHPTAPGNWIKMRQVLKDD